MTGATLLAHELARTVKGHSETEYGRLSEVMRNLLKNKVSAEDVARTSDVIAMFALGMSEEMTTDDVAVTLAESPAPWELF